MNICVVGASGAFGTKHLEALSQIDDVQVTALVGSEVDKMTALGKQYPHAVISDSLSEALKLDNVDAVILATPTHLHASQAIECLEAGKHVLVEIPMADNIEDARRLVETQQRTGLVAVAGHTRRFNPSHQWIHNKIAAGELHIQQMDVQTYFFRRTNTNAKGEPRTWTDHLLWHHACHTVDLFQYQTGESASQLQAMQGPVHPQLGIAMDMSIGMKVPSGALCTLSLSFNNDGPFGTFFRYICEEGTYLARYDDLYDGYENPIDLSGVAVSNNGIELIDREFIAAIREKREPNSSVLQCLSAMETLHKLEQLLENNG
ncbi:Gfo/Idh/MocA family oxidoreductase [Vibrio fluvialis]|uniref:Gfo/Idh/MocA family oxidoreductase n=1 Tax=Vibrio fluvialis TaxID=676 RepID=UPI00096B7143|nr:Gfo/Idh/MocA family oxidoreductase [Vibrio fluvialis]EKO3407688.1 Gfo/Idh/MocA family oxidoreductase [Vibrio fluvialis]ELI5734968.1 Gfo/Idh/MocA family oxidoreductase [Vibrio fluvialis]ELP2652938.1 Gfo/Idh/MocA family oxidoreductase [Vibrio fluvialis]ELV8680617.1 Gfo/Idh/MocA family oxidoreductase [Vibrio fluvialis]EME3970696.1 Gfo/Idh/MocA family oxidoreductase [Vibrio fluvialis]